MKNKTVCWFISMLFMLQILSSCSENTTSTNKSNDNDLDVSQNDSFDSGEIQGSLTIGSGCIGCKHCMRYDSEHFSYDVSNRKAIIISQNNLDSNSLKLAISHCPVKVISIEG